MQLVWVSFFPNDCSSSFLSEFYVYEIRIDFEYNHMNKHKMGRKYPTAKSLCCFLRK